MRVSLVFIIGLFGIGCNAQKVVTLSERYLDVHMTSKLDSLNLWSYDLIENTRYKDSLPLITFFRNKSIKIDKGNSDGSDSFVPEIMFFVRPISDLGEIVESYVDASSCSPPDVGGGYVKLKNFVLDNAFSCVECTIEFSEKYPIDFCRANIENILETVALKDYTSFKELCDALPISRMNRLISRGYH